MYSLSKAKVGDQKQCNLPLCFACLSSNRTLQPLGENTGLFWKLFDNLYSTHQSPVSLCWECAALLRKVKLFKEKVDHAQVLLSFYYLNQENSMLTCLSNLTVKAIESCTLAIAPYDGEIPSHTEEKTSLSDLQYDVRDEKYQPIPVEVKIEACSDNDELETTFAFEPEPYLESIITDQTTKPHNKKVKNTDKKTKPNDSVHSDCEIDYVEPASTGQDSVRIKEENLKKKSSKFKWVESKVKIQKMKAAKKLATPLHEIVGWMVKDRKSEFFKKLTDKCIKCVSRIPPDKVGDHKSCHIKTSTRNIVCELCELTFLSKKNLSNHISKLHRHLLECSVCGFKCYSRDYMLAHLAGHKRNVQCLKCRKYFLSKHAFYLHYRTVHCQFVCDHCGKRCESKKSIRKHIAAKHLPYICKPCNKSYTTYYTYMQHIDLKHKMKIPEEVYCVPCDKHFSNPGSYRWHLKNSQAHAAERPPKPPKDKDRDRVKCPDCQNTYANSTYMKMHYQYVHERNSRFQCKYCGKQLVCKSRLTDHIKSVHEGVKPVKNKFCTICGRGFSSNSILTNHMRTHTGERPYQCEHCDARFSQRAAMRTHIKGVHLKARRQ